jgi:dipeptidase
VWSVYRRTAPSTRFPADCFRGDTGATDHPLFVKPDRPLGVGDVMEQMRDQFEGTPYDMMKGSTRGPSAVTTGSESSCGPSTASPSCGSG